MRFYPQPPHPLFVIIALAILFANAVTGRAEELVRRQTDGDGVLFATLAADGEQYLVLVTRERHGRLPEIVSSHRYQTRVRAQAEFDRLAASWPAVTRQELSKEEMASEVPGQSLWPVTQDWSVEWERRYNAWVRDQLRSDYFGTAIRTDCADVIYATRWIFAREHGLPMVSRLGGSGLIFSHQAFKSEWLRLPTNENWRKDRRFLAALEYLLELTYTGSLVRDSYPIAITPEWLTPGVHYSQPKGETGHNYLVTKVRDGKDGALPIRFSYSTSPREYRRLIEVDFSESKQPHAGGFMRLRWPEKRADGKWRLVAAEMMPGYSLEQYTPEFVANDAYDEAVNNRVAPERVVDGKRKVKSLLTAQMNRFQERVDVVQAGYLLCYPDRCPPGSREYEDFSTPSRDQRLLDLIEQTLAYVAAHPDTEWTYKRTIWNNKIEFDGDGRRNHRITQHDLIDIWRRKRFSSDPNHSRERRWGL